MMEKRFEGRPAAPGIALGELIAFTTTSPARVASGSKDTEAQVLRSAIADALVELRRIVEKADPDAADILGFQVALLEDEVLGEPAFDAIEDGCDAHQAWLAAMSAEAAGYESSEDEYFRARGADIRDIRDRVLAHLTGSGNPTDVPEGSIVVAVDLPPSRFLAIDWSQGGALVLTGGSATSHVAMLARSRGVPAVVGLKGDPRELQGEAVLDAHRGVLIVNPSPATRARFEADARSAVADRGAIEAAARQPAVTRDGTSIRVLLNIADASELDGLDPAICDGIGLVRTELLFHEGRGLPDEDHQYRAYRRIVDWAQGRPVTIRTLDAGGDKPIAGLTVAAESNPFLGVRGVRLSLAHPAVFRVQLRAIARAASHGDVKLMLPMVTVPRELEAARAMLDEELAALSTADVPARRPSLGIMVEVPAAAITADLFDAAFLSIGSNDLTQYVAAAGRDVDALTDLADPVQPAMLRLLRHVVDVARTRDLDVSLCGDAGGDPAAIPLLLGTGLRSLSMAPALVGRAKLAIAATDLSDAGTAVPWPP